jgi:hypothetical protein
MFSRTLFVMLSALAVAAAHGATADPAAEANKKLRESLRNTMIQLRTVETEKATLQATQTELEQKNKEQEEKIKALEKKTADLIKQSATDKAAAEKKESEMASSIVARDVEISRQTESLKKWKDYQVKAEELVKKLTAERASKTSEAIILQRRVDDQQRKNAEMYKIGSEVLERYANFALGKALLAREPFVGTTRAKLETLVQDYSDKLADARIKPGRQGGATAAQPSPTDPKPPGNQAAKAESHAAPPASGKKP